MEIVVGFLLAICGAWGLIAALRAGDRTDTEVNWIEVPGIVTSSTVVDRHDTYAADVTYEFKLNGAALIGRRVRRSPGPWGTKGEAEGAVARYRPGSSVLIYVNTRDPGDSVLETPPTSDPPRLAVGLFGTVFVVGFALIVLGSVR